jgi:hypothetical protein
MLGHDQQASGELKPLKRYLAATLHECNQFNMKLHSTVSSAPRLVEAGETKLPRDLLYVWLPPYTRIIEMSQNSYVGVCGKP